MSEPIETIEYKGFTIKIHLDDDPGNPRTEWDNFGKMVCWHRRYNLGDKHDFSDPEHFQEFVNEQKGKIVILPLYLYDHSGITMNTKGFHCRWDSGQVGWIYATYEDIKKEYSVKKVTQKTLEEVKKLLTSEVETYDQYLTGQVYGYVIEDKEGEHLDSCWGFYDGTDYCIKEAKLSADALEKDKLPLFANAGLLDDA